MNEEVPKIGKKYYFFDDGKTSPSRCYVAEVVEIIKKKEAKSRQLHYCHEEEEESLYNIWRSEIDSTREYDENDNPKDSWLFAEDTDYFIGCNIPNYDAEIIWFVRNVHGGWYSLNIQNFWQGGKLDVSGEIYRNAKHYYDLYSHDGNYDSCLIETIEND